MKFKYVILEEPVEKRERVFVIDGGMNHSDLVNHFPKWKPVSAGFCTIDCYNEDDFEHPKVQAWGESISIGVKSREEDASIISRHLTAV